MAVTTAAVTAIVEQIHALTPEERQELFDYLQEELEEADDIRLTDERLAQLHSGQARPIPADEFWASIGAWEQGGELPA